MTGAYPDWAFMVPFDWLAWFARTSARLALHKVEGWHGPLRLVHLMAMAAFFGAIALLDLRLLGVLGRDTGLDTLARIVLPLTHWAFGITVTTGALLFLYDPVSIGSRSWFLPKLTLLALAMTNAAVFSLPRGVGLRAIGGGALTRHARVAGALSLVLWAGVITCATANFEERLQMRSRAVASTAPAGTN